MIHTIRLLSTLSLAILSIIMMPQLALAERADKNKPIELEADTVTVDDAKKTSTYSGRVILTQGTLVIHADRLVVREDAQGFTHSTSFGKPATFKQKLEGKSEYMKGRGRRIEYDGRMDKVQLHTNASVTRGQDVVYGNFISYDANAEFAEVIGGTRAADGTTSGGRVKAIIQPKNKQTSPSPMSKKLRINKTLSSGPEAKQ